MTPLRELLLTERESEVRQGAYEAGRAIGDKEGYKRGLAEGRALAAFPRGTKTLLPCGRCNRRTEHRWSDIESLVYCTRCGWRNYEPHVGWVNPSTVHLKERSPMDRQAK